MNYYLSIDYEGFNTKSYKGVVICETKDGQSVEIVRANTGSPELDERRALHQLYDLVGNVDVHYLSSYDDYFMDLGYENNPEFKAEADKDLAETEEKIKKFKNEIGKSEDDELTIEEFNYIYNRKE